MHIQSLARKRSYSLWWPGAYICLRKMKWALKRGDGEHTEGHSDGLGGQAPGETEVACLESGLGGLESVVWTRPQRQTHDGVFEWVTVRGRSASVALAWGWGGDVVLYNITDHFTHLVAICWNGWARFRGNIMETWDIWNVQISENSHLKKTKLFLSLARVVKSQNNPASSHSRGIWKSLQLTLPHAVMTITFPHFSSSNLIHWRLSTILFPDSL